MLASLVSALRHTFRACFGISRASFISFPWRHSYKNQRHGSGDQPGLASEVVVAMGGSPRWGIGEGRGETQGLGLSRSFG